ncbi:MAG: hypothetical protein C0392_12130 [Syntrophus sp. (in: bacteria)]|nr:hypothetical protein [Syntrophus sp. (in: bacteria)]
MIEEYIEYWGLTQRPFHLAPDSRMMCITGQYFECFERLKYAINTGKGGALIVSEDAGLGKTTLLLKLINDMKERYGDAFRHAFIDHPTLNSVQMIAQITSSITGMTVGEDKLKNLTLLKNALIEAKEQGGKSIIVVDEGQMLCDAADILQELRILINITHNNEYLHTFILSGQRALWHTIKGMPEFWQRLPVRYYFVPLKAEETKELVQHRLKKAGAVESRDIFDDDALEIIHKYSKGSPRTVIALADLSLLVGYTNFANKIGFKEVSKAMSAMSGQGESLPYVKEDQEPEKGPALSSVSFVERGSKKSRKHLNYSEASLNTTPMVDRDMKTVHERPVFIAIAIILCLITGAAGYYMASGPFTEKRETVKETIQKIQKAPEAPSVQGKEGAFDIEALKDESIKKEVSEAIPADRGEESSKVLNISNQGKRAIVVAYAGNIRSAPGINYPRIAIIFQDEKINIFDEKFAQDGSKWYKILLYGDKEGWISGSVIDVQ